MDIIWTIIKIILFTGVLTIIGKQTYNFIFLLEKKPILWILIMLLLGFLFFMIGSKIQDSFNVVWWSSALTFFALLPPKKNKDLENEINLGANDIYSEIGLKNGQIKYRIGLATYVIGSILGWVVYYGQIVTS
jgi:hypothetical protein